MQVSRLRDMWANRLNRETLYSTSKYWDAKAAEHEGDAASMWPNNHLNAFYHRELISMIEKLVPELAGLRVLDVGCGTGWNSRYLASRGASVVGIDFSSKAVEIARRKTPGLNPTYRVLSIFDLAERAYFDAAVSWGTITIACRNRSDLANAVARIAGSLKPDGWLLLCEPIHRGFLHRVLNMPAREFCQVLTEEGFRIEEVLGLHFWPVRLAFAYISWPRFLTAAGYYLGDGLMKMSGRKAFGDYKAILASVSRQPERETDPGRPPVLDYN